MASEKIKKERERETKKVAGGLPLISRLITRVLTQSCRRKKTNEVLSETLLASESLSVIGQGPDEAVLSDQC